MLVQELDVVAVQAMVDELHGYKLDEVLQGPSSTTVHTVDISTRQEVSLDTL